MLLISLNCISDRILNYPRRVGDSATWWELHKAFSMWNNVSSLTFQYVDSSESADIDISFVTGYHNDGSPFDGEGRLYNVCDIDNNVTTCV